MIPLLATLADTGATLDVDEMVVGMSLRGRLNFLVHTMEKPYSLIFSEFEGTIPD